MKASDLIVPPPIPFADQTFGELAEAAKIYGVPAGELIDDVLEGANAEQVNPANVYERFYVPTGKIIVSFSKLNEAAYTASVADTITKLLKAFDDLEQAVMTEDRVKLTKSGRAGGATYLKAINLMRKWLADPIKNKPPFTIFAKGNQKLPFWTFSTLPGVTCPGAGDCLVNPEDKSKRGWCYSFSAWRYVTAYFRQLQNTLLIRLRDKTWIEADAKEKFVKDFVAAWVKVSRKSGAPMSLKLPFGESRTPTRSAGQTVRMASVISLRKRKRFPTLPPYSSVRRLVLESRNWLIR